MKVLRARIFEAERLRRREAESQQRRGLTGSGDRSERIRTYNFPQVRSLGSWHCPAPCCKTLQGAHARFASLLGQLLFLPFFVVNVGRVSDVILARLDPAVACSLV